MRQFRTANTITDGVNSFYPCFEIVGDRDLARIVQLEASGFQPDTTRIGHAAHGYQDPIATDRVHAVALERAMRAIIYRPLHAHPQVFMSTPKEPHHFSPDIETVRGRAYPDQVLDRDDSYWDERRAAIESVAREATDRVGPESA